MSATQNIYQKIVAKNHVAKLLFALRHYDATTYNHSCRTAKLALQLAYGHMDSRNLEVLGEAALLHDVGKIMIDKKLLNKPGKLTTSEYEVVKQHASYGEAIVKSFGVNEKILQLIRNHHPENSGGLFEPDDPILQILIKADLLDAWMHERPYKPPFSNHKVVELLYSRFHDDASNEKAMQIIW